MVPLGSLFTFAADSMSALGTDVPQGVTSEEAIDEKLSENAETEETVVVEESMISIAHHDAQGVTREPSMQQPLAADQPTIAGVADERQGLTLAPVMDEAMRAAELTADFAMRDSVDLTLEQAVQEALANNQELKAKWQELETANAQLLKAVWPNPELEGGVLTGAFTSLENKDEWDAGFSQAIPWSGRIRHQKRAAKRLIERTTWDIQDRERLLTLEVTRAFTQVVALQEQLDVLGVLIQLNRQLVETAEARFGYGEVSQVEVQVAKVELHQNLVEQRELQAQRQTATSALNVLLGRSLSATPSVIIGQLDYQPIPLDLHQLTQWALEHRPDIKTLDAEMLQAEALIKLAKAERLEDLKVSGFYSGNEDRDEDGLIGLKVSLPIPIFDRKKGEIKEAKAQQRISELTKEFIVLKVEREIEQLIAQLTALQDIVGSYEQEILSTLDQSIRTIQDAYAQGQVSFFELIQTEERLIDFKRSYVEALTNYVDTRAALTTALGGTWPKMASSNTGSSAGVLE